MMMFLASKNSSAPVTYGHDFNIIVDKGYHSGGCGYLLSGEAFKRVGHKLTTNRTYCQNTGIDDVDLAVCLRTLQVYIDSSLDELGRERFLPVNFLSLYIGPVPEWLNTYSAHKPQQVHLYLI
jgi:glycoprotein-N-acetylgalactosamine 3-beta-galactosyltransferase